VTYATVTATITSGVRAALSDGRNTATTSTEVSGSPNMTEVIAPIPIAAPAIIGRPGPWESAIPPAAPMNKAGKVGPPRKLLSDAP
jgi:hypothetical protein